MQSKRQLIDEADGPGWITTFADLMTLLLVFFILLFSMSTLEPQDFDKTAQSITRALGKEFTGTNIIPLNDPMIEQPEDVIIPRDSLGDSLSNEDRALADLMRLQQRLQDALQLELNAVTDSIQQTVAQNSMGAWVEVGTPKDGKIRLTVDSAVMFDPGEIEVRRSMMPLLDTVLEIALDNPGYLLEIQGHTDDTLIESDRYPSHWELSVLRATSVLRFLIEGGLPEHRTRASGYGNTRPLVPNISEENRRINRRIEFILERSELPR